MIQAIDLIDEACANTRVQLNSQPEVIDQLERRKLQLEVEATALSKEDDPVHHSSLSLFLLTSHIKDKSIVYIYINKIQHKMY
jgi:ATP-dependent Clp protease ATP-binding subunit ClpA